MFVRFKKMWGHYIALIIITTLLSFPITWIYQVVLHRLGTEIALLALALTIIAVLTFAVQGATYAAKLDGVLRGQVMALKNPPAPGTTVQPFELKLLGIVLFRYPDDSFEFQIESDTSIKEDYQLAPELPMYGKKQQRFTETKIRAAVEKWDRRDKSFSSRTLEKFIKQEFGSEPSGVPLMAVSTFYDHRRRIRSASKVKPEHCEP